MTDSTELFILYLINDYMDMMLRQYMDSIGEDDYILTKITFYGNQTKAIENYIKYLESL